MKRTRIDFLAAAGLVMAWGLSGCNAGNNADGTSGDSPDPGSSEAAVSVTDKYTVNQSRFGIYSTVKLEADLSHLSDNQRQLIGVLIDVAKIMDGLFWRQAYGDKTALLEQITDPQARRFAQINYGPWDRLNANKPFLAGFGAKSPGAQFYPADMTKAEFSAAALEDKTGLYTLLRRNGEEQLMTVPYNEAYAGELAKAAALLSEASALAEHEGFANYLELRAQALLSNQYRESDMAWMDVKGNPIEMVVGPIENYEDQLFNYKTAFSAYVLLKDMAWSERLARFAAFLPALQRGLPVPDEYKAQEPGTNSDLNAYDVIYYAGDSNAGSKTIAINLPNDEVVQEAKGTRRLQLKNAMRAKFDRILIPIAEALISAEQRDHVTFDAFFSNTMFHEVAHGLGINRTLDGSGTVRQALKEVGSAIEEGKADILGLYMITALTEMGELEAERLEDHYVTFVASIFRSTRFGATSAHGRANMVRFNYFQDAGAIVHDAASDTYAVNMPGMRDAMNNLSTLLLTLQGDGDYAGATRLLAEKGLVGESLQADLDRLDTLGIPVDVVFEQGVDVLGLRGL